MARSLRHLRGGAHMGDARANAGPVYLTSRSQTFREGMKMTRGRGRGRRR